MRTATHRWGPIVAIWGGKNDQDGELSLGSGFGNERMDDQGRGNWQRKPNWRQICGGASATQRGNTRIDNQRERINQGVKNGTLTRQEAQQLRANDRAIKQQEHADVKANGGHLTPAEQKQLNQEENANSTLIRDEKHPQ